MTWRNCWLWYVINAIIVCKLNIQELITRNANYLHLIFESNCIRISGLNHHHCHLLIRALIVVENVVSTPFDIRYNQHKKSNYCLRTELSSALVILSHHMLKNKMSMFSLQCEKIGKRFYYLFFIIICWMIYQQSLIQSNVPHVN